MGNFEDQDNAAYVRRVHDKGLRAVTGAAVYAWHCNRDGEYSLYSTNIADQNYLRGIQVTDDSAGVHRQAGVGDRRLQPERHQPEQGHSGHRQRLRQRLGGH